MTLIDFIERDAHRTLFPLETPLAFIRAGENEFRSFFADHVFVEAQPEGFLRSSVDYVMKDRIHKRRAFVLDPLATMFLYDVVWRNRATLTNRREGARRFYGPSFTTGKTIIDSFRDYHSFRSDRYDTKKEWRYFARVDIFNCFNSFYHHNVVSTLRSRLSSGDAEQMGQYLRELNAGDSIWCFPQGMYPAKVLGNQYLRFIEDSPAIRSKCVLRFLDDVCLFGKTERNVVADVHRLQEVLGAQYLALNDDKTRVGTTNDRFGRERLDDIKKSLLRKRQRSRGGYDGAEEEEVDEDDVLDEAERGYLLELVAQKSVAAEDVELGLSLLRDSPAAFQSLIPHVLTSAPHLLRELHRATAYDGFDDDAAALLWETLDERLTRVDALSSHELFWYVRILLDRYEFARVVAERLVRIATAGSASALVRAAVLETEFLDHGLGELKERALEELSLGLVTYAALYGLRLKEKGRRNHLYKYIGRAGVQWRVVTRIASKF